MISLCNRDSSKQLTDKPNSEPALGMGFFEELKIWSVQACGYMVACFFSYSGSLVVFKAAAELGK